MQEAAKEKLDELKNSGNDTWHDLKSGADDAWRSVDRAMRPASSLF